MAVPAGWKALRQQDFKVDIRYPTVTPQGHAVERDDERINDHRGDMERVHLTSPGSRELYVEVSRFRELGPEEEYGNHRRYLDKRFGADAVTPLTETTVRERRAWAYAFHWGDGERSVLLLQADRDTYRIIYDPRSDLNHQVIATLTVSE